MSHLDDERGVYWLKLERRRAGEPSLSALEGVLVGSGGFRGPGSEPSIASPSSVSVRFINWMPLTSWIESEASACIMRPAFLNR